VNSAERIAQTQSGSVARTRRYLYALLALNLAIMVLIAVFFWYHQKVQDRIFDSIVNYHDAVGRAIQTSLVELHYISNEMWRRASLRGNPDISASPERARDENIEVMRGRISTLAIQKDAISSLEQEHSDPIFAASTSAALQAFEPVLKIGSEDDPAGGNLSAQLELIDELGARLRALSALHMAEEDRLVVADLHQGLNHPAYLILAVGFLTLFGPTAGFGVIRNVTMANAQREAAFRVMQQNEEDLRHLTDGLEAAQRIARVGNWEWDRGTELEWWSDENYRIIGLEPGAAPANNQTFYKTIHEEDRQKVASVQEEAERNACPYQVDFRVVMADGEIRYTREIGEPTFDADGRFTGQRGTIQDITDQYLAERRLAETVRRLEEAQRIARVADWEWDPESDFLDWPPQMREVLGLPESDEQISNETFLSMLHPEDRELVLMNVQRAIDEGEPYAIEYRFLTPDGGVRTMMEYGEPFVPAGSSKLRLRGTVQDITDRKAVEQQLAGAVLELNRAQHLAKVGSWTWDIVNNEDKWSDECYRIHGLEPGSTGLSATDFLTYVHPGDKEAVRAAHERTLATGETLDIEFRLASADGVERIVRTHGEVSYDDKGRPARMTGTVQDVSALRRQERELREIQERFSLAFQLSPSATAISEVETGIHVDVNDKWVEVLGHPREEAIGRTASEMGIWANPEDRARAISLLNEDGRFRDFEAQYRTRSGELRDFMISAETFPIGDKPHMLIVGYDITDRKKTELALRETKERLEEAQRLGQMGSWTWDPEEDVEWWSEEQFRIFGLEPGSVMLDGYGFLKYVHPDDRNRVEKNERYAANTRTPFSIEYRIVRPDGTERIVFEQGEWIEDDISGIPQWRGIVLDITERKHIEQELAKLNAELEQRVQERTAELHAAQEELVKRERLAVLGQLTATVSHELRNPLGAIRTSLFVIEAKTAKENNGIAGAIGRINRSIVRCDNIIDELLDFTRMRELQTEMLNIDHWLKSVIDEQQLPPGVSLHTSLTTGELCIPADPDRLRRAVINVYENACQALEAKEEDGEAAALLSVSTRSTDDHLEIIIEDTGPGFSKDTLARIFEPLYSTKNFGVGLGLPIVQQIVRQHGGSVEARNRKGKGAKFVLRLPLERKMKAVDRPASAEKTL
jgi:PAS domain S-box-containing protein